METQNKKQPGGAHILNITDAHKMFTPVFKDVYHSEARFNIVYGGTASSKSFSVAQNEIVKSFERQGNILVIRKVANTLRDSVIPSFRSRINQMGFGEYFSFNKTDRILTNKLTGSQIIFRGLDDPDKLKSFEGLRRILVEEATELEFEDFLELNRRARGREGIQLTLCFNPVHEEHWIKKHFFDGDVPDTLQRKATYHENSFLTEKDKEQIEWLKQYNYNQYRVYALGEWGVTENNNPWLFAFDKEKHVRPSLQFLPQFPVYLSFDFNREPVSCLAVQMSPDRGRANSFVHFLKEFSCNTQLSELCTQIRAVFPSSFLYVTGDASGSHGDIGFDKRNDSYYQMIKSYLRVPERMMNLNSRNLEHHDSRNLINMLLAQYPQIYISAEGCPTLVNDCTIARVDETTHKPGILKKDRGVYKMDMMDAMRYFFQAYFIDMVTKVGLRAA
jgi:phage terminase large subunit